MAKWKVTYLDWNEETNDFVEVTEVIECEYDEEILLILGIEPEEIVDYEEI